MVWHLPQAYALRRVVSDDLGVCHERNYRYEKVSPYGGKAERNRDTRGPIEVDAGGCPVKWTRYAEGG